MTAAEAFERAARVAEAVLYEGYVLYPYRASSAKNQLRWQFGVLVPRPVAEADGAEAWSMQTELIAECDAEASVDLRVRFLQAQVRTVEVDSGTGSFEPVAQIDIGGRRWATWEEAVEHAIDVSGVDVTAGAHEHLCQISGGREVEEIDDTSRLVRERWPLTCRVLVTSEATGDELRRLRVVVENLTDWDQSQPRREIVMHHSLIGVHALLHVEHGRFLSSLDPPASARAAVANCENRQAFPVLIGEEGDDTTVLASPIILYDRPEVAVESPGDMCDATEIDEILALRVLTLTDDEKLSARATDPRAAAIVDRIDKFTPEVFERLHGTIRSLGKAQSQPLPWWEPAAEAAVDPWSDRVGIGGVEVAKGSKVILRPGRRADAQDLFLAGMIATVEGVFSDVDGDQHVAVSVDDDPAGELHIAHGRFLYFHPDEVEPVG